MSKEIKWSGSLCNGCSSCVGVCPSGAITRQSHSIEIDKDKCINCNNCIITCPNAALYYEIPKIDTHIRISDYDVLIIGGGPAGMTACWYLAQNGIKPLLIEKKQALEYPLSCAEGISQEGFFSGFDKIRDEWVSYEILGGALIMPDGRKCVLHHPNAGYILNRRKMMTDLAKESSAFGAKILVGACFTHFDNQDPVFVFNNEEYTVKCKYIISADGIEGTVKRNLGISNTPFKPSDIHSAAQYVVTGINIEPSYPTFYIGENVSPGGYLWVFPKGKNIANVGVGILPNADYNAITYLNRFLESNFENYSILESTGGLVPAGSMGKLLHENILFTGDSASLTDPLSGAGIANALFSGKEASKAITSAIIKNNPKDLLVYEKNVNKALKKKNRIYKQFRILFEKLNDDDFKLIGDFVMDNFHNKTSDGLDIVGSLKSILFKYPKLLKLFGKITF